MRALISGAGIAGAEAARRLERDGHEMMILERSSGRREGGYMVDVRDLGHQTAAYVLDDAELAEQRSDRLPMIEAPARSLREIDAVAEGLAEYDRIRRPTTTRAQHEGREFAEDFIPR
jgi:monoamine oxidase